MTTIAVIGAGEVGSQLARAAVLHGYDVVVANSRGPESLAGLVAELGPAARADHAPAAAAAGDVAVLAFPYHPAHVLPVAELADKIVLDTNNYMVWRDGHLPDIDSGRVTEHELRQQQLPTSRLAKAFTHVQAPNLFRLARPAGAPDRLALSVSSNHPDAVAFVTRLYDQIGYDTVDNSPLRESWRTTPGTPAWFHHDRQGREALAENLRRARRVARP